MRNLKSVIFSVIGFFLIAYAPISFATSQHAIAVVTPSDAQLTNAVISRIKADDQLKNTRIKVQVDNRVVSLLGEADSPSEAVSTVVAASSVPGVHSVDTSRLKIKNTESLMQDLLITAKIEGKLLTLSNNNFPHDKVIIFTQNGIVYLAGNVNRKQQISQIIDIAKSVSGVKRVVNIDLRALS